MIRAKTFSKLFFGLLYLLNIAGYAKNSDGLLQWRYFPELKNYKIYQMSKIDSEYVLALTLNGIILEWKGDKWKRFQPQPKHLLSGNLITLSP